MKSSFEQFINEKPLYYKEIDHERVHKAYAILKPHIKQPTTIHIVGTNGKGSTGRIIASLLHFSGTKVGHFSSPHILKFNERIWIEGEDIDDGHLEVAHEKLFAILGQEMSDALSYFEYTTLLALVAMEDLEVIVLEAGLGGEFDATNVCSKSLSIITPIGLDHQDFLGETIEEIAQTKINSIEKAFLLAYQVHDEVYAVAQEIAKKKNATLYDVSTWISKDDKKYQQTQKEIHALNWSDYLFENTLSAIYALEILGLNYKIEMLRQVKLFGRFYQYRQNVRIDVGHNLLAANAIVKALQKEKKRPILIYNSLDDKDFNAILKLFKPHIEAVELIEIETQRAVESKVLESTLNQLEIPYRKHKSLEEDKSYLVFGSFYVVESFLKTQRLK
jgi:dihydrofolate synthase/folylpolyglutamate synthase